MSLYCCYQYIKKYHAEAKIRQPINYQFGDSSDCIELILDHTLQKHPFTGWTIQSRIEPCRVSTIHVIFADIKFHLFQGSLFLFTNLLHTMPTIFLRALNAISQFLKICKNKICENQSICKNGFWQIHNFWSLKVIMYLCLYSTGSCFPMNVSLNALSSSCFINITAI